MPWTTARNSLFDLTDDITAATDVSPKVSWVNYLVMDYEEIVDKIDMLKEEFKFRLAVYRKSLFKKIKLPRIEGKKNSFTRMMIPATRNFKCQESRHR